MNKLNEHFIYTLGRICVVSLRPLLLFFIANYVNKECSIDLGTCFLITSLSFIVISMDIHRDYYEAYFSNKKKGLSALFRIYLANSLVLTFVAVILAFFATYFYLKTPIVLSVCICFYLVSEKIIDELQRFYLFEKSFNKWGKMNLQRTMLSFLIICPLWYLNLLNSSSYVIFALILSNLAVIIRRTVNIFTQFFVTPTNIQKFEGSVRNIIQKKNLVVWAYVLFSASLLYVDRIFALAKIKSQLPAITIATTCFSLIQMGIDFFYVSKRRREFLENKLSLSETIFSFDFFKIILVTISTAILLYAILYRFSTIENRLDPSTIVSLVIIQTSIAITAIPQQILYWKKRFNVMIKIDLLLWVLLILSVSLITLINVDAGTTYLFFAIAFLLRMIFNIKLALKIK